MKSPSKAFKTLCSKRKKKEKKILTTSSETYISILKKEFLFDKTKALWRILWDLFLCLDEVFRVCLRISGGFLPPCRYFCVSLPSF